MSEPLILVEDRGASRRITLNRPRTHNAQSPELLRELESALLETRDRKDIRTVVLAGAGRSFSSGHDLKAAVVDPEYRRNLESVEGRLWQEAELFVRPVELLRDLPMPVVCQVHGYCMAAALMLVSACDLVVAADDARFSSQVTRDQGADDVELPTVAWELGERRAKQMLWLSEGLDAEQALGLGLVNWVVPADRLEAKVDEVVAELERVPPEALALSKMSFRFIEGRRGRDDAAAYHFLTHQLSHNTDESKRLLAERVAELEAKLAERG
ncbi:MAG: enoyl-CoA hydratase/isomerase family protein [Solirubrobacterales bacterium]|nr:enoyl-CoA hydratase/isomerase family protein [Solirubrobacterales bacterium]